MHQLLRISEFGNMLFGK